MIDYIYTIVQLETTTDQPEIVIESGAETIETPPSTPLNYIIAIKNQSGSSGSGEDKYAEFYRLAPATNHTVTHNFGRTPNVRIFTLGLREIYADIVVTTTTATVTFNSPESCLIICT